MIKINYILTGISSIPSQIDRSNWWFFREIAIKLMFSTKNYDFSRNLVLYSPIGFVPSDIASIEHQ